MSYSTTVGVDLAKNVIQVSVISSRGKELFNRSLTRKKFAEFLGKQEPSLVAVAEAARRPNIKDAPMKTVEQQGLQALQRARELLIQECVALSNHLRGILLELGITIPQGFASLLRALPKDISSGLTYTGLRP